MEVTYVLSGAMLMLGGKAKTIDEGIERCKESIANGKAYEKFLQLVKKQNGDVSFIENVEKYSKSKLAVEVVANENGFVTGIDLLELGLTSISLGAGRMKVDDVIDMKAGIMLKKKVGDEVKHNETLATFYTDNSSVLDSAKERIQKAFAIEKQKPKKEKLIRAIVDEKGVREF